jgi:hypothetical protein
MVLSTRWGSNGREEDRAEEKVLKKHDSRVWRRWASK